MDVAFCRKASCKNFLIDVIIDLINQNLNSWINFLTVYFVNKVFNFTKNWNLTIRFSINISQTFYTICNYINYGAQLGLTIQGFRNSEYRDPGYWYYNTGISKLPKFCSKVNLIHNIHAQFPNCVCVLPTRLSLVWLILSIMNGTHL